MKKIFVLTGEPSGDILASKVITQLKNSRSDIEYLSVGGEHLKTLGIKSLYDLNEVTYLGFTRVILNIFKIQKKINETVKEIIKFKMIILPAPKNNVLEYKFNSLSSFINISKVSLIVLLSPEGSAFSKVEDLEYCFITSLYFGSESSDFKNLNCNMNSLL